MSLQYIIDGYNLLNCPRFRHKHKEAATPAKAILDFIRTNKLTGSLKNSLTIVFDGYPPSGTTIPDEQNTQIIFSRKISADEKIRKILEEQACRKNIIVVSDDNEVRFMAKMLRAGHIGTDEFIGIDKKSGSASKARDLVKADLSYSQMSRINEELRKVWLDKG